MSTPGTIVDLFPDAPRSRRRPLPPRTIRDDLLSGNFAIPSNLSEADPDAAEWVAWAVGQVRTALALDITATERMLQAPGAEFCWPDIERFPMLPIAQNLLLESRIPAGEELIGRMAACRPLGVEQAVHLRSERDDGGEGHTLEMLVAVRMRHGEAPIFPAAAARLRLDRDGREVRGELEDGSRFPQYFEWVGGIDPPRAWYRASLWTELARLQLALFNGYRFPERIRQCLTDPLPPRVDGPVVEEFLATVPSDVDHAAAVAALVGPRLEAVKHPGATNAEHAVEIAYRFDPADPTLMADNWATLVQYAAEAMLRNDRDLQQALHPARIEMRTVLAHVAALHGLGSEVGCPDRVEGRLSGATMAVTKTPDGQYRIRMETLGE